jgi:hypothetical protein
MIQGREKKLPKGILRNTEKEIKAAINRKRI